MIQQINKIFVLLAALLCLTGNLAAAQTKLKTKKKYPAARKVPVVSKASHTSLSLFNKEAEDAGIDFAVPPGFKEVPAVNNENFSFDYALTLPGADFEVWMQVHSLKQNWASYEQVKNITGKALANPDSMYVQAAQAHAAALSDDDNKRFVRPLSPAILSQYNADAGKTYFFTLANLPETKRYKYALLIALQKDHTGYLMAVCLTNERGPEFFKNINKARDCIRFK
jgi:hypothetical protein